MDLLEMNENDFISERLSILEKSPSAYLEPKDKQALLLFRIRKIFSLIDQIKREDGTGYLKERANKEIKLCHDFYQRELHLENILYKSLVLSYLVFAEALLQKGARSRKSMAVSHSYLMEALKDEKGINHPYFSYYEALLLIGRNKWNEATGLLHKTLKSESDNENQEYLARLLCKLYIHIGMPNVARFISGRHLKPSYQKEAATMRVA